MTVDTFDSQVRPHFFRDQGRKSDIECVSVCGGKSDIECVSVGRRGPCSNVRSTHLGGGCVCVHLHWDSCGQY